MRRLTFIAMLGAMAAAYALAPCALAATATSLSSFEGREEPTVLFHPSNATFTNDSFVNITDQGGGVIRTTLRYLPDQDWWDGDRATTNDDRQRAEVKGLGAHQKTNQTFRYTFDFRTDPNMVGTGSFFHIFQLKSTDGKADAPLVTLSLYENGVGRLKLWSGEDAGSTTVRTFGWTPNTWMHADILISTSTGTTGSLLGSINGDAFKGQTGVDAFRPDATDYRPKWGFYRAIDDDLYEGTNWIEHRSVTSTQVPANDLIWNPSPVGDTAWNTTDANNWIKSGLFGAFAAGNNANFGDTGVGSVVIAAAGVAPAAINVANTAGTYQFSGGPITGSGALTKAGAGKLVISNAINLTSSVIVAGGTVEVNGGSISGNVSVKAGGTLTGAGTFGSPISLSSGAILAPGLGQGTMSIESLTMEGVAKLNFELGAAISGPDYDRLVASSTVQLAGTLAVSLASGFQPQAGQTFDIITASTIQGTFAATQLPALPGDLAWQVRYQPQGVSLTVLPSGDFNHDHMVDAADLATWTGAFGENNLGDADGDGDADGADYLVWQRQLSSPAAIAGQGAVPEPASFVLLSLGAIGAIAQRRRASCP